MGAVWSALLVGGGLAGAIFVWLLRDTGKESDAEQKDAPLGEAAAPGSDQGGGGGLSPGPSRRELVTKPGILPSTSRGQICQGALKFTKGAQKPTWSFSRGPFPRTSLPCPGQDPPHAAPVPRLVRTRRAGCSPSAEAPEVPCPIVRGHRPAVSAPGARREDLSGPSRGGWAPALGAVRAAAAAAPLPGLPKGVLRVRGDPTNPLQSPTEQGHFLSPSPVASRSPILHPLEELGLETPRL